MSSPDETPDPSAAAAIAKAKRLMLVTTVATFAALAIVLVIVGYRIWGIGGSGAPPSDVAALLPPGARVISASVGEGKVAVTIELNGATEVRLFDAKTLKPVGRIGFTKAP